MRTPTLAYALGTALLVLSLLVMETAHGRGRQATRQSASANAVLDTPNKNGVLRTISLDGSDVIKPDNPFFLSLGTNGRSCVSCHVPSTGWTISPKEVQDRFKKTQGLDPIFRTNDGSNSPAADVSTVAARQAAYSMLLNKGLIRIGIAIPAGAEFVLIGVDDPYGFASAAQLSLFRRPLPSTNLRFLTGVMWDGRESFPPLGTLPILANNTPAQNAATLFADLMHQANDATMGHAQGFALSDDVAMAIVNFELNLATAQRVVRSAGSLDAGHAEGGPLNLANQNFYVTINDVLGADVLNQTFNPDSMTLFQAWENSPDPTRAAIARGAKLFGSKPIAITDVGGLNDDLQMPVIKGTCTTCHDTPNVGNHSVPLPIDIGLTDAKFRTADMPLYTLFNPLTRETRMTTDPGRALLTGKWKDIGKFKGPVLRGLSSRAPYFHNGLAADLGAAVDFYEARFQIGFTPAEKSDIIAFLGAL
jgi:cytochrome c peroxidase